MASSSDQIYDIYYLKYVMLCNFFVIQIIKIVSGTSFSLHILLALNLNIFSAAYRIKTM